MNFVNFDNSATSFPKPDAVRAAVNTAFTRYGGNPGRGGHRLSTAAAEQVYKTRAAAAEMFGAEPENTVFTANCTLALNMAIKGIMQFGGHMIISDLEHNAVFRPVYALSKMRGVTFSIAHISDNDEQTLEEIRRLVRSDTKCVCCMTASNVTGKILPYREIAALCKSFGICFISDAAQAAGILDLSMDDGFNFLCMAGHKALYGPSGTGLLISDGEYGLSTIIEGGTGATSSEAEQTPFLPERLESGTVNTAGIIGLREGINFVHEKTPRRIFGHETELCRQFEEGISGIPGVKLYTCERRVPIVSFNIGEYSAQAVSARLSDKGYALRGGLHCSAHAHRALGTLEQGTVRFSPGAFNNGRQVAGLVSAVRQTAKQLGT
jgi:cysteine desulfurase family protein